MCTANELARDSFYLEPVRNRSDQDSHSIAPIIYDHVFQEFHCNSEVLDAVIIQYYQNISTER